MMEMMINAVKKNLEILGDMQRRNEEMARLMLEHAAKTREQAMATGESLLHLMGQQGKSAEGFVAQNVKASREAVEKQVQEMRAAAATN